MMVVLLDKKCPVCGSSRLSVWHFYRRYGDYAIGCHDCKTVFKPVKVGKTPMGVDIVRIGEIIREGEVRKIRRDEMFEWDRKLASLETKLNDCRYIAQRLKDQKMVDAVNKIINRVEGLREHIKKWW
jgi:hypothetical protein